jgi:hypothetical protein
MLFFIGFIAGVSAMYFLGGKDVHHHFLLSDDLPVKERK